MPRKAIAITAPETIFPWSKSTLSKPVIPAERPPNGWKQQKFKALQAGIPHLQGHRASVSADGLEFVV